MDVQELDGRAVVSIQQAEKLGAIEDVLVNVQQHRVEGLQLKGTLLRSGPAVSWSRVRTVGVDAVMVDDNEAATSISEADRAQLMRLQSLRGMRVVTDAGELIGTISSVDVDEGSGQIVYYLVDLGNGGLLHPNPRLRVPPAAIQGVGKDIMTVDARVVDFQRE